MAEYSRLAKGSYTVPTGVTKPIYLPFQPTLVKLFNASNYATNTQSLVTDVCWDVQQGQGTALMKVKGAAATYYLIADTVATNGISTFGAGLSLQFGAAQQIVGATAANPIVFNVTAHGYSVGDVVMFQGLYQSSTTGMPQISGMPFVISAVGDANHFSVVWPGNGGNYTALSGSPSGAYVRKVLYPFLYAPGTACIEAITTGSTTTITTTAPHNFVVGQEIGFRIPSQWGTVELNTLPNTALPGSPLYYYVTSVTNSTTFVCNAVSTGYTAFDTNQTVASVPGLSFPQVFAMGDVNTGGVAYSGSALYPSPVINSVSTINGPAISGAFVNNTRQGFVVGNGVGVTDTSAVMGGVAGNTMYWEAYLTDYANP